MTTAHDLQASPSSAAVRPRKALATGATAATAALATNLVVYAVGRTAGVDPGVRFAADEEWSEVTAVQVAAVSLVAVAAGAIFVWAVSRRWIQAARFVRVAGFALSLATVAAPLTVETQDGPFKLLLTLMHLSAGLWFLYGTDHRRRRFGAMNAGR